MTAELMFWLMIAGFSVTALSATAVQVLHDFSWHELEEFCQRRRRPHWFGRIIDLRDQLTLGALTLQMIATGIAICSAFGWLIRANSPGDLPAANFWINITLITFGLIVASSWIPWAVARIAATSFLFHTWRFWWVISALAWPLLVGGKVVSALFWRASGREDDEDEEEAFEDEIRSMVTEAHHDGVLEADARDMIEGVMELDDYDVSKVMMPRSRVDALEINTNWDNMLEFVVKSGRTRIPVYEEKIDNVVGILYAKDILRESLRSESKRRSLTKLLRAPLFVPESQLLDEMLQQFLRQHTHMAIVQDEYGGFAGVVTIEDVLEEIVGEIVDEADEDEMDDISILAHNVAEVSGTTHINRLNEQLGLALPEDEDFDTISGLIMRQLNEIPRAGRELIYENVKFNVQKANRRAIETVQVTVLDGDKNGKNGQ